MSLIPLRAVLAETHTFETPALFRHVDAPGAVSPASTLAIFVVILLAAGLVAVSRGLSGGCRYRWTGGEWGAAALVVGMIVSSVRAGQKHLAITGSLDFAGLLIYFFALRQLLCRPWRVRLVMATVLATGAVVVAKCGYQRWVEMPSTIRYFQENKAEIVKPAAAGHEANAGFLHDYEQRLRSGAVTGYFAHPNVLGSYLILIIMMAVAVIAGRWGQGGAGAVAAGVILAGSICALIGTQSKGAAAACGIALLCFASAKLFGGAIGRGRAALAVWIAGIIVAVALPNVLSKWPDALGRSMHFRHFYWQAARALVSDQGVLGIGADNFGRHFSRYKDVACPEDVEDPHSWVVKSAVEWGAIGLVGVLAAMAGVTWRLARRDSIGMRADEGPGGAIILWAGAIGAVALGVWAWILSPYGMPYVGLILHLPAIVWVFAFIAVAVERGSGRYFSDQTPGPMVAAMCGGLIGFLLHTGIDLAFFNGGVATTFFAMAATAVALAGRGGAKGAASLLKGKKKALCVLLPIVMVLGGLLAVMLLVRPAARCAAGLQEARVAKQPGSWRDYSESERYAGYERSNRAYRLDGTAVEEMVGELAQRVSRIEEADRTLRFVPDLAARDPDNAAVNLHMATLNYQRFVLGGDKQDLEKAIAAMEAAVAAYPTSPTRRLSLAELYERLAGATGSADMRQRAAKELQKALELDEQRVFVSKPHRMTEAQRAEIQNRISRLGGA